MTASATIAVLGFSARAAAFSVLRAGYAPLAADAFADADLCRVAKARQVADYPTGLADWLASQTADRPDLPWLYTGGLENYPALLARLASCGLRAGNGPQEVRRVRSPFRLARVLADAELAMPETRRSPSGLPADRTWLQKKRRSAGGSGVTPWTGERATSGSYFQRRVAGHATSAVYIAHRDGAACYGVTRQLAGEAWAGTQGYAYCGSVGPWPISERLQQQIDDVGHVVARVFNLCGLFGVDFILSGDTAWVVEINPRYTASVEVLERTRTPPAIQLHLAAYRGERVQGPTIKAGCHGKAIIYATHDLLIDDRFSEQMLAEAGAWQAPAWADIPPAGASILTGRPVLSVFASDASCEKATQRLQQQAAVCRQRLKRLRSR